MALRTARITCFEHKSLEAMIDVCPPQNSEGLFDVNSDAYGIAKLYTSHDELEGVQFRDQRDIESVDKMSIVVRDLADRYYEEYAGNGSQSSLPAPTPWERQVETESHDDKIIHSTTSNSSVWTRSGLVRSRFSVFVFRWCWSAHWD